MFNIVSTPFIDETQISGGDHVTGMKGNCSLPSNVKIKIDCNALLHSRPNLTGMNDPR